MNMTLNQWAANGWLRPHKPSPQEISGLFSIVERDLADAESDISTDWRFGIAYNAALKLCTILLHASGYRPERTLQHYRAISALPLILGDQRKDDAVYLDTCRIKRNTAEYDLAGVATQHDAAELVKFVKELQHEVVRWLQTNHPKLTPESKTENP
jgi:hypothetical protein